MSDVVIYVTRIHNLTSIQYELSKSVIWCYCNTCCRSRLSIQPKYSLSVYLKMHEGIIDFYRENMRCKHLGYCGNKYLVISKKDMKLRISELLLLNKISVYETDLLHSLLFK